MKLKVSVIIPAAGSGTRIGGIITKQFLELNGKPILAHTIEKFQNNHLVFEIIIASQNIYFSEIEKICKRYNFNKIKHIIEGGKTRQESVGNALTKISSNSDLILVHDAVRPFISQNVINETIKIADKNKAAIVGVPVKDTIKETGKNNRVEKTLMREKLWIIQTPQVFKTPIILKAYKNAEKKKLFGNDDATLVEAIGIKPTIILGEYENIKITTKEDLEFAELIINRINLIE